MADKVTAETVKRATMALTLIGSVDGEGFYRNTYRCGELPELVKVVRGPKRRYMKAQDRPIIDYFLDGVLIDKIGFQAIADVINARREARARDE